MGLTDNSMVKIKSIELSQEQQNLLYEAANLFPAELHYSREAEAVDWTKSHVASWANLDQAQFDDVASSINDNDVTVVAGLELPNLPATPERYLPVHEADVTAVDVPQLCISALVGAAYGTAHVRGGRIIADIIPRTGFESKPDSAFGSQKMFDFHADSAVQPDTRADYFSMHCLRNVLRTPTLVSQIEPDSLSDEDIELLSQPVYTLRYANAADTKAMLQNAAIIQTNQNGALHYNYYGESKVLCERPDIDVRPYNDALVRFHDALNTNAVPVVLQPGDIAIVDNCSTLHARPPFSVSATSHAHGRWLRRVHIAAEPSMMRKVHGTGDRILHSTYV